MRTGKLELVNFLIEHGSDLNMVDKGKKTPLAYAIGKNNVPLQTLDLLVTPKNINMIDRNQETPLQQALTSKCQHVIPLPLVKGANAKTDLLKASSGMDIPFPSFKYLVEVNSSS